MDRQRGIGRFPHPPALTVSGSHLDGQYAKLRQVRWVPRMAATGYLGGHVGPDSPVFLKNYVVPLLRTGPAGTGVGLTLAIKVEPSRSGGPARPGRSM